MPALGAGPNHGDVCCAPRIPGVGMDVTGMMPKLNAVQPEITNISALLAIATNSQPPQFLEQMGPPCQETAFDPPRRQPPKGV